MSIWAQDMADSGYEVCRGGACNRPTWNGKAHERCCRSCQKSKGKRHGPMCEANWAGMTGLASPSPSLGVFAPPRLPESNAGVWAEEENMHSPDHRTARGSKSLRRSHSPPRPPIYLDTRSPGRLPHHLFTGVVCSSCGNPCFRPPQGSTFGWCHIRVISVECCVWQLTRYLW